MAHTDLARLRQGGVGAVFFAAYVAASYGLGPRAYERAQQVIDIIRHDIVERYPNDFVLATTAAQIEAAHKQGKIAALIGIEGGHAIRGQPGQAARILRPRRALHDADAHQHQQLGGFVGRRQRCRR